MSRRFIYKILIFCLPFIVAFGFIGLTAFYFGELLPYRLILQWQANNPNRIYYSHGTRLDDFHYKLTAVSIQQPDVMAIGSSRVISTSSAILNRQDKTFYNFGLPWHHVFEMYQVLSIMEADDNLPDLLIIGLDLPDYNAGMRNYKSRPIPNIAMPDVVDTLRRMKNDFYVVAKKWLLSPLETYDVIQHIHEREPLPMGFRAIEDNYGDRYDGSRYFGFTQQQVDKFMQDHILWLNQRGQMYQAGQQINNRNLATLAAILEFASQNDIQVVGYWPPYYSTIYAELVQSDDFAYIPLVQAEVAQLFADYDMPLFDFTDLTAANGTDDEMRDGWHTTELLDARIYTVMYHAHPEIFAPYIDIDALTVTIENADNPFNIAD